MFPTLARAATPSFTIGVWSQPASAFSKWAGRGVNTIVGYNDSGASVSFSGWNTALAQQNLFSIRTQQQALAAENADPRLLALMQPLFPNDSGSYLTPVQVQQAHATLRAGAPNKPVFLTLDGQTVIFHMDQVGDYQGYSQGAEWLGNALYPVNQGQAGYWTNLMFTANEQPGSLIGSLSAWSGGKPVYQYIEAANLSGSAGSRGPTAAELRGEIWDSVINGAKGIIYVPQSGSADDGTDPNVAAEITREDQLLRQFAPVLAAPGGRTTVSAPFEAAYRDYNGSRYTFVLNYSPDAANYQGTDYAPNELGIYVNGTLRETVAETTQVGTPKPPAFVIGVWNQPAYSFSGWRSRGVNTIVGYQGSPTLAPPADNNQFTSWDAELNSQGLFTIRAQQRISLSAENSDPRLLALSQIDEPDINGTSLASLQQVYSQFHTGAPGKPVFLNFAGGQLYTGYPSNQSMYNLEAKYGDWIANDIYPVSAWNRPDWIDLSQSTMPLGDAPGGVASALSKWSGGKPQYQFIESSNQCVTTCFRAPTADEMRGEIWDSVIHGVRGIIYFPQIVGGGAFSFDGTPSDLVAEMTRQDGLLSQYASMLVAGGSRSSLPIPLEGATRNWNGRTYRLILNYSHSGATYNGISLAPYTLLVYQSGTAQPILIDGPGSTH